MESGSGRTGWFHPVEDKRIRPFASTVRTLDVRLLIFSPPLEGRLLTRAGIWILCCGHTLSHDLSTHVMKNLAQLPAVGCVPFQNQNSRGSQPKQVTSVDSERGNLTAGILRQLVHHDG